MIIARFCNKRYVEKDDFYFFNPMYYTMDNFMKFRLDDKNPK